MEEAFRLGPLQLKILQTLWRRGQASSVAEVQQALTDESLAYTTVATMLRKMEQRGLVAHQEHGRKYLYRALATPEQVTRSAAQEYLGRVFQGDLSAAVSHLLEASDVDADELAELERMIQSHRRGAE